MCTTLTRSIKLIIVSSLTLALVSCGKSTSGVDDDGDGEPTAFWQITKGPTGGTIHALVVSADGEIFAGADGEGNSGGGIFRSKDGGVTWTAARFGLTNTKIPALAIDSRGALYACTRGSGVFRSADNGATWEQKVAGLTDMWPKAIAVNDSDDVFIGTVHGVFRSKNNGESWEPANNGLTATNVNALAVAPSGHVFAGTNDGGVFISTDDGSNWAPRITDLTNLSLRTIACDATGDHIYAGTVAGLFVSSDEGDHWSRATAGLSSGNIFVIAVAPNGDVIASDGNGLFRSPDDGATWVASGDWDSIAGRTAIALAFAPGGHVVAGTYQEGVFHSPDNGYTWTRSHTGLTADPVLALGINALGNVFAGTERGAYRTTDGGDTWVRVFSIPQVAAITVNSSGHVFAGTFSSFVWRSTSNGDDGTWEQKDSGSSRFIRCLAVDSGDTLFAGTYNGMYRSSNNGDTWSAISLGLPAGEVRALTAAPDGNLFCALSDMIYRSTNNGDSWQLSIDHGCTVNALAAAPNSFVLAGFQGCGVRMTRNSGGYWDWTGTGNENVRAFAVNSEMEVFAGLDIAGVMTSADTCATFTGTQLYFTTTWCLAMAPDGRVWAGTNAGVYKTSKSTLP